MRVVYFFTIFVLALVLGFLIWQSLNKTRWTPTAKAGSTLNLKYLPPDYCPVEIKFVAGQKAEAATGRILAVKNCREVDLSLVTSQVRAEEWLFFKLPRALPFRLSSNVLTAGTIEYAPELGDVNEDSIIDAADEALILTDMFQDETTNDIDGDKKVTAMDLAYVRLHKGVQRSSDGPVFTEWEKIR